MRRAFTYNKILLLMLCGMAFAANRATAADGIVFITEPFSATAGNPSQAIVVEAQTAGVIDTAFNETADLFASSPGGVFSAERLSWQDTAEITFAQGRGFFYYKDPDTCGPEGAAITVFREGVGSATQAETVQARLPKADISYMTINSSRWPADGITACTVTVTVNDSYGFPVPGIQVTLVTSRGSDFDTVSQPHAVTDASGQCTGAVISEIPGSAFITAYMGDTITRGVDLYGAAGIWHFDTDGKDLSGNNYDGVNSGGLWVNTPLGSGIQFNGISSYFECDTFMAINTGLTVEAWVKVLGYPSTNWAMLLGKMADISNGPWDLILDSSGNGYFGIFGNSEAFPFTMLLDEWAHIVGVYDSGIYSGIYLNGVEQSNAVPPASAGLGDDGTTKFKISNSYPNEADNLGAANAVFDEVKIYSRALSTDEISMLYNRQCRLDFTVVSRLVITSPLPFSLTLDNTSMPIIIEAQDKNYNRIVTFNDTVTLSTTSLAGRFSVSNTEWLDTTAMLLADGRGIFYYKDSTAGNPEINVTRQDYFADSLALAVFEPWPNEAFSYMDYNTTSIPASGSDSLFVTVCVKDTFGYPVPGFDVTLFTSRGPSFDSVSASPRATDGNGQSFFSVSSPYCGIDNISALCGGVTITNNILPNYSFESGSDTNPDGWYRSPDLIQYMKRDFAVARSGYYSAKVENALAPDTWINYEQVINVDPAFRYRLTGWIKTGTMAAGSHASIFFHHMDADENIIGQTWSVFVTLSGQPWAECAFFPVLGSQCAKLRVGCSLYQAAATGSTAWFDDVRVEKLPGVAFEPVTVKITSPPFMVTRGNPSPEIALRAEDLLGNTDPYFNGAAVIASSSASGRFSADRASWSADNTVTIAFSSGFAGVYYKDPDPGAPVISVYFLGSVSDTQAGLIVEPFMVETNSYIMTGQAIRANGISTGTVVVVTNDTFGYPVAGISVTLVSSRGNSTVIQPSNQVTGSDGQCTFVLKSSYDGADTITAVYDTGVIRRGIKAGAGGIWYFEEQYGITAADASGNNNNGTLQNSVAYAGGRKGSGLYFSGAEGCVDCGSGASLDLENTSQMTVMFWADIPDTDPPTAREILCKADQMGGNAQRGYRVYQYPGTIINFQLAYDRQPGNNYLAVHTSAGIDTGWHHVAITYNGDLNANNVRFYVDGAAVPATVEASALAGTVRNAKPLLFGRISDAVNYFRGFLDEVMIYPYAFTPSEVKAVFVNESLVSFSPVASRLEFASETFSYRVNYPSGQIAVEARDPYGSKDAGFSETFSVISGSATGRFSVDRVSWSSSNVTDMRLSSGSAFFYYRDTVFCTPVITVYRQGLGADTLSGSAFVVAVSETASFIWVRNTGKLKGDGTASTVNVVLNSPGGERVDNESVSLYTQRGNALTTIAGNPQLSDTAGMCTFTILSAVIGQDTIYASASGKTIRRGVYGGIARYFPMEEQSGTYTSDQSGLGADAALNGSSRVQGMLGRAIQFDGAANYLDCGTDTGASFEYSTPMSFLLWLNMGETSPSASHDIISKIDFMGANVQRGYRIIHEYNGTQISFQLARERQPGNNYFCVTTSGSVGTGWRHFAVTYSGSNDASGVKMYLDGQQVPTNTGYNALSGSILNTRPLQIARSGDAPNFWKGILDEIKIYKSALSAAEVLAEYNCSCPVEFIAGASKLAFVSAPQAAEAGIPSGLITVQAQDNAGNPASEFNDTAVLSSTSGTGKFSISALSWVDTVIIPVTSGSGSFYYKDSALGTFTLTASSSGLAQCTQAIVVKEAVASNTTSCIIIIPYKVPADGISKCDVSVAVNVASNYPLAGRAVILQTPRGAQDAISGNPGITDAAGMCTFTISSGYAGPDTVIAVCEGQTITSGASINRTGAAGIWGFENSADDLSGNSNTGTVYGAEYAQGKFNRGLAFSGISDYVDCGSDPSLGFEYSSPLTIMFWVSLGDLNPSGSQEIINKAWQITGNEQRGFRVFQFPGTVINFQEAYERVPSLNYFNVFTSAGIGAGWRHIAITYNGDNSASSVNFYVDGALAPKGIEANALSGTIQNTKPLLLGRFNDAGGFFKGSLDEVRIYNRVLSSDEIRAAFSSMPTCFFTGIKLGFSSDPFEARAGSPSPVVTVCASGELGGVDSSFANTAVSLASSSDSGSFSLSAAAWIKISQAMLSAGKANFYYKDYKTGNPVITAWRVAGDLDTGTQSETIGAYRIRFLSPVFAMSAINTASPPVQMVAQDYFGETDIRFNSVVNLTTTSTHGFFSVSSTPWQDVTAVPFSSGYATFYYRDRRAGYLLIEAMNSMGLYCQQLELVTTPVILAAKSMKNLRTGDEGWLVAVGAQDTVEYDITIINTGTETASAVTITDTLAFDTVYYSPMAFLSIGTEAALPGDTWSYTTDPDFAVWITGTPPAGAGNVKGVRWRISALAPGETRMVWLRMRVK